MPKITYTSKNFGRDSRGKIDQANSIIAEYQAQGFDLTLRQLYYQFVSRDILPNNQKSYSNLGNLISDARLAGLIDWEAIQDRTRYVRQNPHWESPKEIIESCASQYRIDRWESQPIRPEVWIEKDALIGVIEGVCREFDIAHFSCRGYTSQSEMWRAAQRLKDYIRRGQTPIILHFGDHDPSGKDMSRDIKERLALFLRVDLGTADFEFRRLALNMDQIEEFGPPPNPAKITDSRAEAYIEEFGEESWELDALDPKVIAGLIKKAVRLLCKKTRYQESVKREKTEKRELQFAADNWDEILKEGKK
jgi:hypothetical protein